MNGIGERIKLLRKKEGLNQIDFCKKINLSQVRLSEIEKGKNNPSYETLESIKTIFNISLDWLVSGKESLEDSFIIQDEDQIQFDKFGERLRIALKDADLTQIEATNSLGISKNAIGNYVNGRVPEASILYRLSKLCNVSMEWLLTGQVETNDFEDISKEEYYLISFYSNCSLSDKNRLIQNIKRYSVKTYKKFLSEDESELLSLFKTLNLYDKIKIIGIIESSLKNR